MGSREVKWQQEGEVGPESLFPCEDGQGYGLFVG